MALYRIAGGVYIGISRDRNGYICLESGMSRMEVINKILSYRMPRKLNVVSA